MSKLKQVLSWVDRINEWTAKGWHFDSVQFVVREASKRPSMAFIFFTRQGGQ